VEVDNPLPKPFAMPTFWIPNVILSSDYLISVTPLNNFEGNVSLSIANLLSLLPNSKYRGETEDGWDSLFSLGIDRVLADLYFTLPFDLGIVEARQRLVRKDEASGREFEDYNKIFISEPYEVDTQVAEALGMKRGCLDLRKDAKVELGLSG